MYYRIVLHWVMAGFMPVSCVIGMTIMTYRQIRQAAKQRSKMARVSCGEGREAFANKAFKRTDNCLEGRYERKCIHLAQLSSSNPCP